MSISIVATETQFRRTPGPTLSTTTPMSGDTGSGAELSASLLREKELLRELSVLAQQQDLMAEEFEHRLGNSLQMIVSLLSLQSLAAATPETAAQLTIAAGRVAAFGRVHRRLHCTTARRASTSSFICKACAAISPI